MKKVKIRILGWRLALIAAGISLSGLVTSCRSEEDASKYDPSKPFTLEGFTPNDGKFQEKVIITASNLPTDVSLIRVYFNNRRAPVIGSTGTRMYVMAPRLPGDTCVLSVVVEGNDSLTFPEPFYYTESITVTTIAGNGDNLHFQIGDLSSAIIQPRYICVDKDGNLFVSNRGWGDNGEFQHFLRISEAENTISQLDPNGITANVPCADPITGIVSVVTETSNGSFFTCDPLEYWSPRVREMKPQHWGKIDPDLSYDTGDAPNNPWKHCMVVNPTDGYMYTRYRDGQVIKVNQETLESEEIYQTVSGDVYGMCFNPLHPNILYMAFWEFDNAHGIYSMDVTNPVTTFKRLNSPLVAPGFRDGPLSQARFNQPCQIFCDNDGFMYIADYGNHCIRRITPEGMVETVLGMPGTAGFKDGTKEEALFNNPRGIGIAKDGSVYVTDYSNCRVRKLSTN